MKKKPFIINITGSCGKTTTAKIIEFVLTELGYKVGLVTTVGTYIKGRRINKSDSARRRGYELLERYEKKLDFIICENALRPPNLKLISFYRKSAGICLITNIYNDHLSHTNSKTLQDIAFLKGELIDKNKPSGITLLNGDSKYLVNLAKHKRPKNLSFFSKSENPKINKMLNIQNLYRIKNNKILKQNKQNNLTILIESIDKIPFTFAGKAPFNVENLLASISVLNNLPLEKDSTKRIEKILQKFNSSFSNIPGRLNLYKFDKFNVILDFAQNPESYKRIFETVKSFPKKRLITLIKASSTKPDQMILEMGRISAKYSDRIIIKESFAQNSPKRKKFCGKIAHLLKQGIEKQKFDESEIITILDEEKALKLALKETREGDLILVLGHRIDNLDKILQKCIKSFAP